LASLETESDSKSRDNLEGLNDSMWVKTSPPYIYEGAQLIEGYPIIKNIKALLFYLQTLTPLFQTLISCLPSSQQCLEVDLAGLPILDQPRVLLP
jgi:hypothetical protein